MAGEPGCFEDAVSSASGAAYSVPWALGPCSQPSMLPAGWTAYFFPLSLLPSIYGFLVIQLVATAAVQAACELLGFNLGYSKFASTAKWKSIQIPSRVGLLLFYLPAALIAALFLSAALGLSPALHLLRATHMLPHSPSPLPPTVASWMPAPAGTGKPGWEGQMGVREQLVAAIASEQWRLVLVCAACLVHYSKRCLETLFLHRFSGTTCLVTTVFIMLGYCTLAYVLLSSQWLTAAAATLPSRATTAAATAAAAATVTAAASTAAAGASAAAPCSVSPTVNLMPLGLPLFLIGIAGNFYHHWLLTRLRSDGSHEYRVPHGGLFEWVTCPHYLFECIDFLGVALMSQTVLGVAEFLFTLFYLCGRSIATRRWYRKKMDDYPASRWAIIPFLL